jgi:hypothetical protein
VQQGHECVGTLTVSLSFSLVNQFGNAEATVVMTASCRRETLGKMTFSNIQPGTFMVLLTLARFTLSLVGRDSGSISQPGHLLKRTVQGPVWD